MIGGIITSAILNLLIYPVIYVIWRKRDVKRVGLHGEKRAKRGRFAYFLQAIRTGN
jgi:hypothetical protein